MFSHLVTWQCASERFKGDGLAEVVDGEGGSGEGGMGGGGGGGGGGGE